jgi:hypothetical protein
MQFNHNNKLNYFKLIKKLLYSDFKKFKFKCRAHQSKQNQKRIYVLNTYVNLLALKIMVRITK